MSTIVVLGAGMMGSALCVPLVDRGHRVRLVGTHLDRHIIQELRARHYHLKLELELPREISPYEVEELPQALAGAELVVLGVSSAGVGWAAQTLGPHLEALNRGAANGPDRDAVPIAMVSKGLVCENGSLGTLPDLFVSALPEPARRHIDGPVTIGGPCIAGELARRVETCVVLGSRSESILERVASMLSCPYYHVWTSTDLVGVAFCAALKNAYAMGMAFASGLHERIGGKHGSVAMHNYEAAVFAESVHEMMRLAVLFGAEPKTVYGLAGVGDLHVTCNGGRTGRFGRLLGLGLSPRAAEQQMEGATLECLEILAAVRAVLPELERAGKLRPGELPLFRHMAAVALDGEPIATPFEAFFGASWF